MFAQPSHVILGMPTGYYVDGLFFVNSVFFVIIVKSLHYIYMDILLAAFGGLCVSCWCRVRCVGADALCENRLKKLSRLFAIGFLRL